MSTATEIPLCKERRFKGMPLDMQCYEDFIKIDCLGGKVQTSIPSRYLQEPFLETTWSNQEIFHL
jgi:hypothetical protein